MTFRDFARMSFLALSGKRVGVMCSTERDARQDFLDYVELLRKYAEAYEWEASGGTNTVRFDGCGYVRFYSTPQRCDGIDMEYVIKDEHDPLRDVLRRVRLQAHDARE